MTEEEKLIKWSNTFKKLPILLSAKEKDEFIDLAYKDGVFNKVTRKRMSKPHGHITHLEVNGLEKTRQEVYDDMKNNNHIYITYVDGYWGALLHIDGKWLSTNENGNTRDNLDKLPNF